MFGVEEGPDEHVHSQPPIITLKLSLLSPISHTQAVAAPRSGKQGLQVVTIYGYMNTPYLSGTLPIMSPLCPLLRHAVLPQAWVAGGTYCLLPIIFPSTAGTFSPCTFSSTTCMCYQAVTFNTFSIMHTRFSLPLCSSMRSSVHTLLLRWFLCPRLNMTEGNLLQFAACLLKCVALSLHFLLYQEDLPLHVSIHALFTLLDTIFHLLFF